MKFGDWNVVWGKVDVTKVSTAIVHYAKMYDLISYDLTSLCKACYECSYLIKKHMKLDSTAYTQFLTSLGKDMHKEVMELWEKVSDGYRGWQASHSYWKYSVYESVDNRSRVELNVTVDGSNYRIFVTYKVHKTKSMADASMTCEVVVVNSDKLPMFGEYGIYYANMCEYSEKEFDIVLSAVQQPEVCFTYDNLGRVRSSEKDISKVLEQYKQATGEDMDTADDSMYVRFAYDNKHGYVHIVVLHFLRDGSIVLNGAAHKILMNNVCNIAGNTLYEVVKKLPADNPTSIGFPVYIESSLFGSILEVTGVSVDDVRNNETTTKLVKVDGDRAQGFNDTEDKTYLVVLSVKDNEMVNVVITLLDNSEAICLSQILQG